MNKSEKFNKTVKKFVEGLSPEVSNGSNWVIVTSCGGLSVTLHEPKKREKLFSVFMKFESPDLAKDVVDCNPFSGKWNIHTIDPDESLKILKYRLSFVGVKV